MQTKQNQNIIDISIQEYGNREAAPMLIEDNPQLFDNGREFEISSDLTVGYELTIREEDDLLNKKVVQELDDRIIINE